MAARDVVTRAATAGAFAGIAVAAYGLFVGDETLVRGAAVSAVGAPLAAASLGRLQEIYRREAPAAGRKEAAP